MMTTNIGGKERTKEKFENLTRSAGFTHFKLISKVYRDWIIELYKN